MSDANVSFIGPNNREVPVSSSNPLPCVLNGSLTSIQGSKNTVTAGTRVQLATDQACRAVFIKALRLNAGYVYVGTSAVSSTAFGNDLAANEGWAVEVANLNQLWIDTSVSGEGVTYFAI